MAELERTYNVPLRKGFINTPRHRRAKKASKVLREFLMKHMKSDEVKIGQHLNHHIWKNGMKNPPHHVRVRAVKDEDGVVRAELEGREFAEAVRPEEASEPEGLKEKLAGRMGADEEALEGAEQELADEVADSVDEEQEVPSRSSVESMTKDEIKALGEDFGVELSTNDLKKEMIDQFFEEVE